MTGISPASPNVAPVARTEMRVNAGVLAGGASSPVRAGHAVGGAPFVQAAGHGAYAVDEEGRTYVDYVMAYGPLLFGHAYAPLIEGLEAIASRGTVFGSTHAEEERLAQRISGHVPSVERLRFVTSGTEAVMSALRVARAFTGRSIVLRFAGNYHGHFDAVLVGAGASAHTVDSPRSGIPARAVADVLTARYNDLDDLDAVLHGREEALAAILVEPIACNMGLVLPDDDFLPGIFERARRAGALVIFDEVITWLRVGPGGAQAALDLRPDLTAFGKAMGAGWPLAAFGGRADVMDALAPQGAAFTGGTFSGNPFCVAMGHRMLDVVESDLGVYARLHSAARKLAGGLRRVLAERALPYAVTQMASMVDLAFCPAPPRNDREAQLADPAAFAAYYHAMRERLILLPPSPNELMFLSTAHGDAEIERTIAAASEALHEISAVRAPSR